ncbi:DNA-directed RNA polymerase II subunit rpb1, partial [Gonapodya sp. JEL0774]
KYTFRTVASSAFVMGIISQGTLGYSESSAPSRRIRAIQFGLLSPEEVTAMSSCTVVHPESYHIGGADDGSPVTGGLADPRMGTVERDRSCATCGEDSTGCQGHFGHIELCKPVFHLGFLTTIKKILESVCLFCGRLKANPLDPDFIRRSRLRDRRARFRAVWSACKTKMVCAIGQDEKDEDDGERRDPVAGMGGCGRRQPRIRKEGMGLFANYPKETDDADSAPRPLLPDAVRKILLTITDTDLISLGLNPTWS